MAEVRKAQPATSQSAGKGPAKRKQADPKKKPTGVAGIRKELGKVRRDHRMQQLDSPAKLRDLRKSLARELTKQRAVQLQQPKEANG